MKEAMSDITEIQEIMEDNYSPMPMKWTTQKKWIMFLETSSLTSLCQEERKSEQTQASNKI